MEIETEVTEAELSPIQAIHTGECPSLSGQSTLTYAIGRHPEDQSLHLRIVANSGGGMFCDEWASGSAIDALVQSSTVLISRSLCELHAGRSINTGGFVLSVLKHLGLVRVNAENSRHHEMVPGTTFEQVALDPLGAMGQVAAGDKRKTLKIKKGEVLTGVYYSSLDSCSPAGHLVQRNPLDGHCRIRCFVPFVPLARGLRHRWRGLGVLPIQDSTEEKTMTYLDSISTAMQRALDWDDIPEDLLPLVIVSEASQLSAIDSDAMGSATWH